MNNPQIIYRPAAKSDIGTICDIVRASIAEMKRHNIFQWDELYPNESDFLSDMEKGELFVGAINGDIAVFYTVNAECDEAYKNGSWKYPNSEWRVIHRLCVSPKYQNRGLAKQTLSHIESNLREAGVEAVRLDVFSQNPFALSLYQQNGYIKVGEASWRKGIFFLMEKKL